MMRVIRVPEGEGVDKKRSFLLSGGGAGGGGLGRGIFVPGRGAGLRWGTAGAGGAGRVGPVAGLWAGRLNG